MVAPMLLAETVTFDTGDVVFVVVAFLLFLLIAIGLAVVGVWCGWIAAGGKRPTASAIWGVCVVVEALLVLHVIRTVSLSWGLLLALPLGAALLARLAPRS